MSLDLTLLPFDHDDGDFSWSHTVLQTYGGDDLYEALGKLNQLPVPKDFNSYVSRDDAFEESHYGRTVEDPYGEQVKYTIVSELLTCNEMKQACPAPVWAYLNAIKPDTKVALFWH